MCSLAREKAKEKFKYFFECCSAKKFSIFLNAGTRSQWANGSENTTKINWSAQRTFWEFFSNREDNEFFRRKFSNACNFRFDAYRGLHKGGVQMSIDLWCEISFHWTFWYLVAIVDRWRCRETIEAFGVPSEMETIEGHVRKNCPKRFITFVRHIAPWAESWRLLLLNNDYDDTSMCSTDCVE